ncbi:unnamed protein product [Ceratitis capitata]|uniref:(Mediterranean fruit fly) hypothetical protein n=1 Tax=Ceratitis capitata TaxID=7213 RepID=A0A811UTI2_CERCA|nr:unnamed protein product [Ceratitis capitata]
MLLELLVLKLPTSEQFKCKRRVQSSVSTPPIIASDSRNEHLLNYHDDLNNSHVSITEMTVHAGPNEPNAYLFKSYLHQSNSI